MSHFQLHFRNVVFCVVAVAAIDAHCLFGQSSTGSQSVVEFPYQAIVRNEGTEIFSGPAAVHYATDRIGQGEIVQVYRHDPGGWCAIRPNPGSFSLIPAGAAEIVSEGIGTVLQDNTQAWVGTRLGSVEKPLWQIKLKAGEEIEILGEASWPSPDGHSTIWYQIAPPAGEFRWVRLADLSTPPTNTDPSPVAHSQPLSNQHSNQPLARRSEDDLSGDRSANHRTSDGPYPNSNPNVTNSGFTYVDRLQHDDRTNQDERTQPANSKPTLDADVGFKYVADTQTPAQSNRQTNRPTHSHDLDRDVAVNDDKGRDDKGRDDGRRDDALAQASQWTRSQTQRSADGQSTGRQNQPGSSAFNAPQSSTAFAAADRPASDTQRLNQQSVDFKFRPIGQSATIAGRFQTQTDQSPTDGDADIIQDAAVSPAAFQSPIQNTSDRFEDSGWQRGRSDIAQRRSQYEARYDQFNQRDRFDHRDVEESFGVQWDEIPPTSRDAGPYNDGRFDVGQSYPSGSSRRGDNYSGQIQNPSPSDDRYASLALPYDTIGRSTLAEKLTTRLAKVEQELTNEMLKRPNEWQLADLELNVGQIYSQTTNPMERLQSQRILDKIKKCKVIRNGYTRNFQAAGETFGTSVRSLKDARGFEIVSDPQINGSLTSTLPIDGFSSPTSGRSSLAQGFLSGANPVIGSGIDTDFELNARFDAVGWLTELVSEDRNNRPVYVLVNQAGEITYHVAGVPGLNLHRYLKSKVGITGRRGYNNRMKLDHITAQSIDELQQN